MSRLSALLAAYDAHHRHPVNRALHWLCVPVIALTLIGLLWSLPSGPLARVGGGLGGWLTWGSLALVAMLLWYAALSWRMLLAMSAVAALIAAACRAIAAQDALPAWALHGTLFVLAWIGQFIGHRYEGRRPAFLQDVQFLLVGPAWLLVKLAPWLARGTSPRA